MNATLTINRLERELLRYKAGESDKNAKQLAEDIYGSIYFDITGSAVFPNAANQGRGKL